MYEYKISSPSKNRRLPLTHVSGSLRLEPTLPGSLIPEEQTVRTSNGKSAGRLRRDLTELLPFGGLTKVESHDVMDDTQDILPRQNRKSDICFPMHARVMRTASVATAIPVYVPQINSGHVSLSFGHNISRLLAAPLRAGSSLLCLTAG